jgi:hypothetical protein
MSYASNLVFAIVYMRFGKPPRCSGCGALLKARVGQLDDIEIAHSVELEHLGVGSLVVELSPDGGGSLADVQRELGDVMDQLSSAMLALCPARPLRPGRRSRLSPLAR